RRVKIIDSNGTSYSMYSQAGKLLYRETKDGGINYIFLGDKLIAKEGMMPVRTNSRSHYKPFGDSIEAPKDDVGYTGHKYDTDLGWSYMQQRYKDPVVGRFMSNDPVGFTGEVDTFNRYSYVANNPYKYTDPTGEAKDGDAGAALGELVRNIIDNPQNHIPKRITKIKTTKEQAAELKSENGDKVRVTLRSEKIQLEVDLEGKPHNGVDTPHTKESPRNEKAPEHLQPAYNTSEKKSKTTSTTQAQLRAVRKHLKKRKK
ncbi:MAG: RHS repeat-associated protein, partial [Phenylobacterium sp.]